MSIGALATIRAYFRNWLKQHLASLIYSLGVISRQAMSSLMAICMIGFALALPTGLYLLIYNAQLHVDALREPPQISLYLKPGVGQSETESLIKRVITAAPNMTLGRIITPDQALQEFRKQSGFTSSLENLSGKNPLPTVVLLQPQLDDPELLQDLVKRLQQYPQIEFVQADLEWLQRLSAILKLAERGLWVLALFLATGAVLIVANILRLSIESRKEEIAISSLFGANSNYIRRPFLYHGSLYGLGGAILAVAIVFICKWTLSAPLEQLNHLFDSRLSLLDMTLYESLLVLLLGLFLGLTGAWWVVSKHLHTLEPE